MIYWDTVVYKNASLSAKITVFPSFPCFSWTWHRACSESAGHGAHPGNEAKGAAEILRRSFPAGHGTIPHHRLSADSWKTGQVLKPFCLRLQVNISPAKSQSTDSLSRPNIPLDFVLFLCLPHIQSYSKRLEWVMFSRVLLFKKWLVGTKYNQNKINPGVLSYAFALVLRLEQPMWPLFIWEARINILNHFNL